jgi:c-di-AMP phosphodiesterase-like protein
MEYFCRQNGVNAKVVVDEKKSLAKPLIKYLKSNGYDRFIDHDDGKRFCDGKTLVVVVDTHIVSLLESEVVYNDGGSKIIIDHHRRTADYIDNATIFYHLPLSSSTCEMVSEILQYINDGVKVRSDEADCMYSGIMIDTNNFMSKTGVRTFEAAAFLRRCGADVTRVRKLFRDDAVEYKTKADAVSQAEIYRNDYAISVCKSDELESPTIVGAQAANELLNIKGIKASFVLTEYQGKIYVSARSIDEVNVQVVTERLGGGGHMTIAGCQFEGITVSEGIAKIKACLDEMIEEGEL